MKKLFFVFSLLLMLSISGVHAASISNALDFSTYDNKTYNLESGVWEDNINYSSTNRVVIPLNSEDNTLYFNNSSFHHIVFFNEFNNYIGYANTDKVVLELSMYIGYDVAADKIIVPDTARKFALIVYNYNDTRLQTAVSYGLGDTLTYNDIFGFDTVYGGSNNLLDNPVFYDDLNFWSCSVGVSYCDVTDGVATVESSSDGDSLYRDYTHITGHTYYLFASAKRVGFGDIKLIDYSLEGSPFEYINYSVDEFDIYSIYGVADIDAVNDIQFRNFGGGYTNLDINGVGLYDLTAIFGINREPTQTIFEGYKTIWEDPYSEEYDEYYFLINLTSLTVSYMYDNTPSVPLDAQTTLDDKLTLLGADNEEMKVFMALGIMIIAAVFIGLKTKNSIFVIMAEAVLILIFTMLGWFSFWILLLIALICVLALFKTILKKE